MQCIDRLRIQSGRLLFFFHFLHTDFHISENTKEESPENISICKKYKTLTSIPQHRKGNTMI